MGQLQLFVDRGALRENVAIGNDGQNWRSAVTVPGLRFPDSHSPSTNGGQSTEKQDSPREGSTSGGDSIEHNELVSLRQALQSAEAEKKNAIQERDAALSQSEESKKQAESILAEAQSLKNDADQTAQQAEEQKEKNALLQDQFSQQQSQHEEAQQDLAQRQAELESRQNALDQAREEIAAAREEIASEREQVKLAREEIEQARETFEQEVAEFESKRKHWEDADQEKEGREKDIEMRLSQLETRDQELTERENQVSKLEGEVQSIRVDLAEREKQAIAREQQASAKQKSLETLENELAVLQRDIDNRTELLESREQQLQSKLQSVKESEARFGNSQELQQTLQQRDAELARRETNLLQQISSLRERQEAVATEKQNLLISMARREEELARRERELLEREATFVKRGFQSEQGFLGDTAATSHGIFGGPGTGQPLPTDPTSGSQMPPSQQPATPTGYAANSPMVGSGAQLRSGPQMGAGSNVAPVMPISPGQPGGQQPGGQQPESQQSAPHVPLNYSMLQHGQQIQSSPHAPGTLSNPGNTINAVHAGGTDDDLGNGKVVSSADNARHAAEHRAAEFERRFGPCAKVDEARSDDRMSIDVCIHPPHEERDFTTLVTSGMSNYPVPMPHGKRSVIAELLLYVTHVDRGSIELLRSAAMIPFIKKNGLAFGSTGSLLDQQVLGIEGSQLDSCVFMLPVIDADSKPVPPAKEGGPTTQPFWLVPITSAERKLIDFSGIHKFLPLLERNNHPIYFDATRECYVRRKSWFRR